MDDDRRGDDTNKRGLGVMSDKRRERIRLEISREAARLFWEQGVEATTGEQIAAAVGLSVRTIWRYFRNKESCAEPVLAQNAEEFGAVLRRWPRERSFEDHYTAELTKRSQEQEADELLARKMIVLAETEPALRAAWLMTGDGVERQFAEVIAERVQRSADDLDVRMHAAAATAVLRVLSEDISHAVLTGAGPVDFGTPLDRAQRATRILRVATGGVLGNPVEP